VVTVTTVSSFKPMNPNSQMATDPFITQSKIANVGIIDVNKYKQEIKYKRVK